MSPSRKTSTSSHLSEETEIFNLIVQKIKKYGPLSIQSLLGHLLSLPPNVRSTIWSNFELRRFLSSYPEDFVLNEIGKVSLSRNFQMCNSEENIINGRGEIVRIFPTYGFLQAPQGSVFFKTTSFANCEAKFLQDLDLRLRQRLGFDAKRGSAKDSAEFQATRVWCLSEDETEPTDVQDGWKQNRTYHSKKKQGASTNSQVKSKVLPDKKRYKKNRNFEERSAAEEEKYHFGRIQNTFQKYGFIEKTRTKERIFFHMNTVQNRGKFSDLRDILKLNDPVEFACTKSTKKANMWEATQVWLKGTTKPANVEEEIEEDKCSASEQYLSSTEDLTNPQQEYDENSIDICDCRGKIFPISKTTAEIKFGKSEQLLAKAVNALMYYQSKQVEDLMWEFSDGDSVHFDATRGDGETVWNAFLVWIGPKPKVFPEALKKVQSVSECTDTEELDADDEGSATVSCNEDATPKPAITKTPEYACWGDSPFLEEELDEVVQDDKPSTEITKDETDQATENMHYNVFDDDASDVGDGAENTNNDEFEMSDEDNAGVVNEESSVFNEENNVLNEEVTVNLVEEPPLEASVKEEVVEAPQPGVYMFEDLEGRIIKLYRYIVQLKNNQLRKPVSVLSNDLYYNGAPLKDNCTDSRDLLKDGDVIHFSCFEIIDDEGTLWQKVTLAWIGKKPPVSEMEPQDFITSQNLVLSCKIPTWKSFRKNLQQNAEVALPVTGANSTDVKAQNTNQETAAQGSKFLSMCDDEKSQNNVNAMFEKLEQLQEEYDVVPDSLMKQFSQIRKSLSELRKNISDPISLQGFETLSMDIESAAESCVSLLQQSSGSEKKNASTSVSCQTDNVVSDHQSNGQESSASTSPQVVMVTMGVQTLVTGKIFSTDIFPS